jgi:integrase
MPGLKKSGAKTNYIQDALGHSTESQTQTYLDSFEKGDIEYYENKLFNQL